MNELDSILKCKCVMAAWHPSPPALPSECLPPPGSKGRSTLHPPLPNHAGSWLRYENVNPAGWLVLSSGFSSRGENKANWLKYHIVHCSACPISDAPQLLCGSHPLLQSGDFSNALRAKIAAPTIRAFGGVLSAMLTR